MKTFSVRSLCIVSLTAAVALSACHFGNGSDGAAALAKKKRQLSYSVTVALPSVVANETPVEDLGTGGLNVNWGEKAQLAVFGKEFQTERDTTGAAVWPEAMVLTYDKYRSADPVVTGAWTQLAFDFAAWARHGVGESYATLVNILYPYSTAVDKEGNVLKARVDSVPFNFTGQDGTLATLREKYYVALGRGRANCVKTSVSLRDSADCLAGHDHESAGEEMLLMEPKMAVVRLSLIVPAQDDFTLVDYVLGRGMSGTTYYIDRIVVSNQRAGAKGIGRTLLDLNSGWMTSQASAATYLMVEDNVNHFWKHSQIAREEAQPLADVGGTGESWGTSVYLAVPCVDEGQLDFEPLVTVYVNKVVATGVETTRYYGRVEAVTLRDGCYYITSPIALYTSMDKLGEAAQVCRVP